MAVALPGFDVTTDKPSVTIKAAGKSVPVTFTFTRTSAPLAEFAKGFVTLTGPTRVRMPVALRPVAVKAPASVAGTGAEGRTPIEITAGFTGDLDVKPSGLAKATTVATTIASNAYLERDVDVDSRHEGGPVRRRRHQQRGRPRPDRLPLQRGRHGTGSGGGPVRDRRGRRDGHPGELPFRAKYLVEIHGYAAAPGETSIATTYDEYLVDATATLGSFKAEPDPVPVKQGETTSYDAVWSGLTTGRYLGMMEYDGALSPTYVTVSVP